MLRALAYSLIGLLLGATLGFGAALFLSGPQFLSWTVVGAVLGVLIGLGLAYYVTRRGLLGGPFMTKQQADAMAYVTRLNLRGIPFLPMSIVNKLTDQSRSYLESLADKTGE